MNSNTLFCNLSFYGLHSFSGGIGVIDVRIKHRYQLVLGTTQGAKMVAEDVASPEVARLFAVPAHVFHLPLLRQLLVSNALASLNLGSTIFKYVTPRTISFVEEVVERSGVDGFWMVVEVDVRTVDTEDCVNLSAYGWREMESGDEDEYGDGDDDDNDNDDDEVTIEPGLNIGEEDGDRDGDGDEDGNEDDDKVTIEPGLNIGEEDGDRDGDGDGDGDRDEDGDNDSDRLTVDIGEDGGAEDDDEDELTVDEGR